MRRTAVLLALGSLLVACAGAAPETPAAANPEAELFERIRAEIGDARCSRDDECRTLPIGAKACGGPQSYIAWSATTGRGDVLARLSAELAAAQRERQRKRGEMSDCMLVENPGASCVEQRCTLRSSGRTSY